MTGVNIDVTDRKEIEEALRRSEERFRLAVKAINDTIWDIDLKAGTVTWNDTSTLLYGRPETADSWQFWIDRIHSDDRSRTVGDFQAALGRKFPRAQRPFSTISVAASSSAAHSGKRGPQPQRHFIHSLNGTAVAAINAARGQQFAIGGAIAPNQFGSIFLNTGTSPFFVRGLVLTTDTDASLLIRVVGVGDFNGDGRADVLWFNASTGALGE
jgi:hypothetical protein